MFWVQVGVILLVGAQHLPWTWRQFLSEFLFQSRGDPTCGNLELFVFSGAGGGCWFWLPQASWVSAVRTEMWAFAVLSRLGFKQEVCLLGVALLALVTWVWGPSRGDPTWWCPRLATNIDWYLRLISSSTWGWSCFCKPEFLRLQQSWRLWVLTSQASYVSKATLLEDHRGCGPLRSQAGWVSSRRQPYLVRPYCCNGIGFGSKWEWSCLRVPNTCHENGLKF